MSFLFFFLLAFLVGAIPTGYLVVSYFKRADVREFGSGNVGATNVFRIAGKKLGSLVFIIDLLKGFLPVVIYTRFGGLLPHFDPALNVWVGLGAIIGHIYTPFLGFKGGKGIATGAGVILGSYPVIFFIAIGVWGIMLFLTRIVSLSSLLALLAILTSIFLFQIPWVVRIFFILIVILGFWTHHSNIRRLLKGEEEKLVRR